MTNHYSLRKTTGRTLALLWLLLLGALGARAQSGPYGNEWIVPGQPYYKLKTWRDGIYRLDYAYLSQLAGASTVAPSQLQLWRRGKEVAVYQGGNAATLDNSTYLEFFGQRNDATLDVEMYKSRFDQSNPHYAFYSDTAAYFITWGNRAGKRMAQPVAAGGTPHAWRLQVSLTQFTDTYAQNPEFGEVHLPWLQRGEGFFSGIAYLNYNGKFHLKLDSVLRAVSAVPGVPAPRLDVTVQGGYQNDLPPDHPGHHVTSVGVIDPATNTVRELAQLTYKGLDFVRSRYALRPTDIDNAGQVTLDFKALGDTSPPVAPYDIYRVSWWTVTVPQQNVWFGDRRLVRFANDSLLGGPATYEVDNIPGSVIGYDVQDPWNVQRIAPAAAQVLGSTAKRFVFPSATDQQTRDLLLFDASRPLVPPAAQRIVFRSYAVENANYFIITHPQLMAAAGSVPSAARAYAAYRASAAGGRYDTLVAQAPRLYDQFHYGERSVMALRNFARWAAASSKASSKYLLLLGRAIEPGLPATDTIDYNDVSGNLGNPTKYSTRVLGERGLDLVPTTSQSPSDTFLSDDWPNSDFVPALATGRIPVLTPAEVLTYLDKLKDYESQLDPNKPNPDSWHKNVLHLVGGETASDFQDFGAVMDRYRVQLEHPLLGASVTTFRRTTVGEAPVAIPEIVPQVNAGLLKISYFGHGSPSFLDLNPPSIANPVNGYRNLHKYPIFEINGCAAANCFFIGRTIVTDWLLMPNVGAVGLAAQTGSAYIGPLDLAQHLTNQLTFNDPAWFGMPVGDIRREVIRRLQPTDSFKYVPGQGNAGTEQLMCTMWHGDPALRLFAPAKPDFAISNATLAIRPIAPDAEVGANSTQFTLAVGVSNPGRITYDSLEIQVTRTIPANGDSPARVLVYKFSGTDHTQFRQAFRRDTTYTLTIPNVGNVFGDNTFEVFVDFRNKVAELSESNNKATLTYPFLKPGFTLLSPTEFAIVRTNIPRLVAQNNDINSPVRGYEIQVDSVASFDSNSGGPQQSQTLSAGALISYTPKPLAGKAGRDSVVWYWRVRFTAPVGVESPAWQTGSFRVISTAVAGGWSQSHNGQFNRDQLEGVAVSVPGNRWSFTPRSLPVVLRTIGGGASGSRPTYNVADGYGIQTDASVAPDVFFCTHNSPDLLVTVLDEHTLQRIPISGTYTSCGKGDQTFYQFATSTDASGDTLGNLNNSAAVRANLLAFLQNVPDGAYVLLVSENRLRYASPDLAPVLQILGKQLGSKLLGTLKNGDPLALVAQKYTAGGRLVAEQGPDRSLSTPANVQRVELSTAVSTAGQAGTILSTRIGPAKQWLTLYDVFERPLSATASYRLELLGIDASNNQVVLKSDIKTKQLDLSDISISQYPYLQLRLTLRDSVNRVPPQLREWFVTYHGIPEGVAMRDASRPTAYDSTRLRNQAISQGKVSFPVKFDNVSQEPFVAPLKYKVELINSGTGLPLGNGLVVDAPRAPAVGDSAVTISVSLDLTNRYGTYYPQVTVNPGLQPEQYYFNNVVKLPAFTVPNTNIAPVLDVAVDGRHILSGELVSPTPVIDIQLKDADLRRHINNASYFSVYLQSPGALVPVAVDVAGPQVHFSVDSIKGSVARLEYLPGLNKPLADGVYTLHVQGRNPNGNSAGTVDFEVKFEVVNASTITNVFPYPNPVTSKAKFVFTVTGQELPRNMKIQIMTLTGKVVREIFMNELGPLHIGNNITDYAWDGTDQYGDRLANGTYLYRVSLDDASGQFSRRATAADRAFKNDWGKLVLLR